MFKNKILSVIGRQLFSPRDTLCHRIEALAFFVENRDLRHELLRESRASRRGGNEQARLVNGLAFLADPICLAN